MARMKIIRTGVRYVCRAPEYLTMYNKAQNKEVHAACRVKPKFNVQTPCKGCAYLEIQNYETRKAT